MRAHFYGNLKIVVKKEDRNLTKIKCAAENCSKPRVILRIVDRVTKQSMLEGKGFHMQCFPRHTSSRESRRINIWLSKEKWQELITEYHHDVGGSGFESRCMYDRFEIFYYNF